MRRHKAILLSLLLAVAAHMAQSGFAADQTGVSFDVYGGYFVSNKFEPDAAESYLIIASQEQFDAIFGAAFVMRDKSHRLPPDIFKANIVVAVVKRGSAMCEYKVESVSVKDGAVELKYSTTSRKSDTATFACPLIVSIPRGQYAAVQFIEDGKPVKKLEAGKGADNKQKSPLDADGKPVASSSGTL